MKASTVAALEQINRDFYRHRALEFSDTRKQGWPGWERVVRLAREHLGRGRISVLDLGCGNGRFAGRLELFAEEEERKVSYLGVDASLSLLGVSARRGAASRTLSRALLAGDLVRRPLAELGGKARFDLIVNFGLMHHVPSRCARRRLMAASAERLRPGGLLAVSFWQFGGRERFEARRLPWRDAVGARVDREDLEDDDYLLAWGDAGAARYCHFTNPIEAAELVGDLHFEVLSSFRADGSTADLNLYWVLRNPVVGESSVVRD